LSGTNDFFQNGKNVIFTDRPGVVTNITLAFGAAVAPAFMTVNAQLNNYNISGAGKITGTNSLLKTGAGKLTLSTSNDYTGPTIVSNGTLIVNGSLANTPVTVMNGASLGGNGTLGGDLTINPGGTLSPGTSLGTLTVAGPVLLAGAISMELNQGLGTNDVLQSAATIQYGGVLSLTNISGALTVADSFKLFSAPAYSGSFAKLTPAIPALNLAWDTNTLATDGTLRILSVPTPQPQITQFGIRAGNLILAGANGVAGWPYCLLATTNLALPLSAWTCLATNQFDDTGSFAITAPANPSLPRQFFLLRLLAL